MNIEKYSSLIIFFTLFLIATSAVASGESQKTRKNELVTKVLEPEKYHLRANFSAKTQKNLGHFRISSLGWSDGVSKSKSTRFGWQVESGSNIWKPKGTNPFTNIPLDRNPKSNTPISPEKIHIDYQDLYPENPVLPSLKLVFSKNNISDSTPRKNIMERKTFLLDADEIKISKGIKKAREILMKTDNSFAEMKTDNSLNVASANWEEKNNMYLTRRTLGLGFDPVWRYAKDRHYTVFQRRFHKTLKSSETIELVFNKNISHNILEHVVCNIRISYSESSKRLHVFPHKSMKPILFEHGGKSVLRLDLSYINKHAHNVRKTPFLEEMIIFYPAAVENVVRQRPLQTILFHEQDGFESTEYLPPASLEKINTTYLLKRELGLAVSPTWWYKQDRDNAVFKRRLHKDISLVTTMDIILNGETITDKNQVDCHIRLSFSAYPRPSEVVSCGDLPHKTLKIDEKHILRIELSDLVYQHYAQGKEKVFLEELTVYLPDDAEHYVKRNFLENVRFYIFSPYLRQNTTPKKNAPNSSEKEMTSVTSLKGFSTIQFFSRDFKRIVFDLRNLLTTIDPEFKLETTALSVRPLNFKRKSGLRLQEANALIPKRSEQVAAFLSPGYDLNSRWGGPFPNPKKEKGKVQLIQVNAYFPYEHLDKNNPYISGNDTKHGVSTHSTNPVLRRLSKRDNGTELQLLFFKKHSFVDFTLSSIGPFDNDRIVGLNWEIEGPIQVTPVNSSKVWTNDHNGIQFLLPKGTPPKFTIKVIEDTNLNPLAGNRGRILLKQAKIHGIKSLRIGLEKKHLIFPKHESSQISLEGIHIALDKKFVQKINPTPLEKIIFHESIKKDMSQINPLLPNFKERPFSYRIKQLFNSSPDASWRYYSEGGRMLFQRHFNKDLSSIDAIDFAIDPRWDEDYADYYSHGVDFFSCDLHIESKKNQTTIFDTFSCLELGKFIKTKKGGKAFRVDLNLFKEGFLIEGKINGFLKKIVLHIPKKGERVFMNWPLEKIVFLQRKIGLLTPDETLLLSISSLFDLARKPLKLIESINFQSDLFGKVSPYNPNSLSAISPNPNWHYRENGKSVNFEKKLNKSFSTFDNIDLVLSASLGFEPLKNIDCSMKFKANGFFRSKKSVKCLDLPFILMPGQNIDFPFSNLVPEIHRPKSNVIKTRDIEAHTPGFFSQWHAVNDGLVLKGEGLFIEIDWKVRTKLENESRFYLGVPEGAESILSAKIIPVYEEQSLRSIPILLNSPVKLSLPKKDIDRLKIHLKFSDNGPFRLVLNEMALFEPISIDPPQAINLPTLFPASLPLTPTEFQGNLPMELSIKNEELNATVLTKRGMSETFNWSTKVDQKPGNIQWIEMKHLLSPSIYAGNPCWLELTLLGANQKINQTICTNSPDGQVQVPVNNRFTDDILESILWTAHVDNRKNLLPLFVNFSLKSSLKGVKINTIRNGIGNTPILEIEGHKISPVFNLPAEKIISRENWLDLGIHPIDASTFNTQGFRFLDHPFLRINSILADKFTLYKDDGQKSILETKGFVTGTEELPWVNLAGKLLLLLVGIIAIRWLWVKAWWLIAWQALKANTDLVKSYSLRIFSIAENLLSMVYTHTIFLNRAVGLIGGAIILLADLEIGEPNFIALALILAGVVWHEARQSKARSGFSRTRLKAICFGKNQEIPILFYYLTITVIAWLGWQVAHLDGNQSSAELIGPILSLAYFYLPWSVRLFGSLPQHSKQPCLFWLTLAGVIYLMGTFALLGGISFHSFLNILSLGSLAMVPTWSYFIKDMRPKIENRWPDLAKKIYAGKDTQYITGFMVMLIIIALFRILHLELLAEQFAILGFYILIIGIILKFKKTLTPSTISTK